MKNIKIGLLQAKFRTAFVENNIDFQKLSGYQPDMKEEDFSYNQALLLTLMRKAASEGAELVVSPESYHDGWSFRSDILQKSALCLDGPQLMEICAEAKRLKIWACIGAFRKYEGRYYNSAFLISADGIIVGIYDKTHETKDVLARMPYTLGGSLPIFETPWGRISICICHDRWYSEGARLLAMKGAEIILNPIAANVNCPLHKYYDIHRCTIRAQAYQNGLYWVICSSANHGGSSWIVGPDGSVIGQAGMEQEVKVITINTDLYHIYGFKENFRNDLE